MQLIEKFDRVRKFLVILFDCFDVESKSYLNPVALFDFLEYLGIESDEQEVAEFFANELQSPMMLSVVDISEVMVNKLSIDCPQELRLIESLLSVYESEGSAFDEAIKKEVLQHYVDERVIPLSVIEKDLLQESWRWAQWTEFTPKDFIMCLSADQYSKDAELTDLYIKEVFRRHWGAFITCDKFSQYLSEIGIVIPESKLYKFAKSKQNLVISDALLLRAQFEEIFKIPQKFKQKALHYLPRQIQEYVAADTHN